MYGDYICRVCEVKDNLKMLFTKENEIFVVMLQSFANVSITEADNFPQFICTNCAQDLKEAFTFKLQYENTRRKFINQHRTLAGSFQRSKCDLECLKSFHISNDDANFQGDQIKDCLKKYGNHSPELTIKEDIHVNDDFLESERRSVSDNFLIQIDNYRQIRPDNSSANEPVIQSRIKVEKEDHETESESSLDWNESISDSKYSCNICGEIFAQDVSYEHHRKKHKMQRPFHCDQCDKTFNVRAQLRIHKMLHRNPNSFQCKQCGKSYIEPRKLRAHELLHSKPDLFKCKLCNKSFVNSSLLNEHLSIHSNPDRFKCEHCGRNFYRNTHLKRHKLLHTTGNGFKCDECNKWFQRQDEFNVHQKLHENPNLFKCDQCGKLFKRKATLKEHEMMHRNPNVFKCEKCDKVYSSSSTLRTHRKQHSSNSIHCK